MNVINADLAQQGAETGALLAASRANRKNDEWTQEATIIFKLYAKFHHDGFMTEDVRIWADKLGFPHPPDQRAWGFIASRLAKEGYIKSDGYGKQRSANCHRSPKTIWKLA
jgi:hypothetical protein